MGRWKDAFKVEKADQFVPNEREQELIDKFGAKVCQYGLATPAILFLESSRPLNFLSSQGMLFFEPVIRGLFEWQAYSDFARMLERRGSVEALITGIEQAEMRRCAKIAASKKAYKEEKRARRRRRKRTDNLPEEETHNEH